MITGILIQVGIMAGLAWLVYDMIQKRSSAVTTREGMTYPSQTGPLHANNKAGTSTTVTLPLTTTTSCTNFCNPMSRCAATGQQCFTDSDCPGCQPYSPPLPGDTTARVPGANDAGKLTVGATPTYSALTAGYGTQAGTIPGSEADEPPPEAALGKNMWQPSASIGQYLFNKRFRPPEPYPFTPTYPSPQYTLTGTFQDSGPLPSNYSGL